MRKIHYIMFDVSTMKISKKISKFLVSACQKISGECEIRSPLRHSKPPKGWCLYLWNL